MLVFRVSEGSGFVQHQYRRILQYGTRHAYPLGFAAGEKYAFVAYPCVVSLRQTLDEIVALGGLGGGYHLFFRGIRRAYGDVLIKSVVKKESVLKYK